jgi:sialate O-acetylesterase
MKRLFGIAYLTFLLIPCFGQIKLSGIFTDHMVLQRQQPIPIWGWAKPGEKITVTLGNKSVSGKADKQGKWNLHLPPFEAGGPYVLTVKGSNIITLQDVLIGEVWLCSGQSNMEWSVAQSMNAKEEIAAANYPNIRHFKVDRTVAALPQENVSGSGWQPATPEYVGQFTGVGYFFARHLQQELNVPIGLLNTSWGGTHVETWTSREAFEGDAEFAAMINRLSATYIDSIQKEKVKAFEALKRTIESKKDNSGAVEAWPAIGYNASGWATLNVPGLWEQQGFEGLDGIVWMRREVEIQDEQSKEAILHLGMIDDNDITWVNGVKVGETIGYNKERNYKIPAGLLKKGKM